MGGPSLASTMAVLLLLLLPLAYGQLPSTFGVHPTGVSYSNRSPQGLHGLYHHGLAGHRFGKREAEPSMVMAILWLLTIPPTMPLDMEFIITDTARGLQHITSDQSDQSQARGQRGQRGQRTATGPGIITTVEEAKKLDMLSTSVQPGIFRWCNASSSKYLAMCDGGGHFSY